MATAQTIPSGPQRTYPRWCFSFPLEYEAQGQHMARALDISEGGMGFVSDADYSPGTQLKVKFRLPEHAPTVFELPAEVRWCSNHRVGTQFVGLSNEARMGLFVAIYEAATRTR